MSSPFGLWVRLEQDGQPVPAAAVTYEVYQSAGGLLPSSNLQGVPQSTIQSTTDAQGYAGCQFKAPLQPAYCWIKATTAQIAPVWFLMIVGGGEGAFPSNPSGVDGVDYAEDSDGDGDTDAEELAAGNDPKNPSSHSPDWKHWSLVTHLHHDYDQWHALKSSEWQSNQNDPSTWHWFGFRTSLLQGVLYNPGPEDLGTTIKPPVSAYPVLNVSTMPPLLSPGWQEGGSAKWTSPYFTPTGVLTSWYTSAGESDGVTNGQLIPQRVWSAQALKVEIKTARARPYAQDWVMLVQQGLTEKQVIETRTLTIPAGSSSTGPMIIYYPPVLEQYNSYSISLLPVEVVELSPKTKDEAGNEIAGSERPATGRPLAPFVEVDPNANKIAHREIKVKIGDALKDKKVTWTLEALPGATPATIRGQWEDSPTHKDRFEASTAYGANGFRKVSQLSGETTVGADGHTAIRVNVPPIGFNQVRVKIQIEGSTTPINLIDMEVPGIVVIDPGHGGTGDRNGGSDPDHAECPKPPEGSGLTEKVMTLDYGTLLRSRLQKLRTDQHLNLKIYMSREGDTNPSLADRANKARDTGADILISLHFNGYDKKVRGTETFYRSTGNVNTSEDSALAGRVNASVFGSISSFDSGAKNRGVKSDGLGVLSDGSLGNTADFHPVRAVLLETEFIDVLEVDKTLNTNANAATVKQDIIDDLGDALLDDLRNNPAQ